MGLFYANTSKDYAREIVLEANKRNIRIQDLEKSSGLSAGYLSRCRNGTKHLSIESINAVSNYLDVDFVNIVRQKYRSED